jgi:hypothetical protein
VATTKKKKKTKTARRTRERYVLVTTAHRGVFAGLATKADGDTIALRQRTRRVRSTTSR